VKYDKDGKRIKHTLTIESKGFKSPSHESRPMTKNRRTHGAPQSYNSKIKTDSASVNTADTNSLVKSGVLDVKDATVSDSPKFINGMQKVNKVDKTDYSSVKPLPKIENDKFPNKAGMVWLKYTKSKKNVPSVTLKSYIDFKQIDEYMTYTNSEGESKKLLFASLFKPNPQTKIWLRRCVGQKNLDQLEKCIKANNIIKEWQ